MRRLLFKEKPTQEWKSIFKGLDVSDYKVIEAVAQFHVYNDQSLSNIIKTVVREHHWEPHIIMGLFLDEEDHHGIVYWYNDVIACIEEAKSKT